MQHRTEDEERQKSYHIFGNEFRGHFFGTFGTVYWRQFFLSKTFFTIFSIIVTNSFCAVLAIRALFRVLKQEIIFLNSKLIGNLKNLVIATKAKKFNLISLFD